MNAGDWIGIGVAGVALGGGVAFLVLRHLWGRARPGRPAPSNPYEDLRALSFRVTPQNVALAPGPEAPHVWGVTMELRLSGAIVTLVSFGDGSTSMYLSRGGAILGGNRLPEVAAASKAFVRRAEYFLDAASPCTDTPLPAPGMVHFYLKTFQGLRRLEVEEAPLTCGMHPCSPLFQAADDVLTQLRLSTQKGPVGPP